MKNVFSLRRDVSGFTIVEFIEFVILNLVFGLFPFHSIRLRVDKRLQDFLSNNGPNIFTKLFNWFSLFFLFFWNIFLAFEDKNLIRKRVYDRNRKLEKKLDNLLMRKNETFFFQCFRNWRQISIRIFFSNIFCLLVDVIQNNRKWRQLISIINVYKYLRCMTVHVCPQ